MHHLYQSLAAIVGSKYVSDEDYVLLAYSRDTSPFPARVPGIVVRPGSTEGVSSIIRVANRTHTPVM